MAHIHTKYGQHDLTASAYIFMVNDGEPRFLLHKHKLLKKYLQIGGHVELSETPWQAIAHELKEEAGYKLSQLKILQPKQRIKKLSDTTLHTAPVCVNTHVFKPGHYHVDIAYAFITSEYPSGAISKGESTDIKWVSANQLKVLTDKDIFLNVKEIAEFIFTQCLNSWEAVDTGGYKI